MREDPYYWLRDDSRTDPDVLAHLRAETTYAAAALAPVHALQETLYAEMLARLKQDDASAPVLDRGYWYLSRFEVGRQHPIVMRRADAPNAAEHVLLDCNALAAGQPFFQLGSYEVSPDNRLLAYTTDVVGRRQFQLRIIDLTTGVTLADCIDNVEADLAWTDDNRTLLYIEKDPVTLLGRRVRAHQLGAPPEAGRLVYEEADESFYLGVERSRSDRYLYIAAESTTSSEWRFARCDDPELRFEVFSPRESDHEYQLEDLHDEFFVRTNHAAENFRIVRVPAALRAQRDAWRDVVAHDPQVFVDEFTLFHSFIAVSERSAALRRIRVQRLATGETFHLRADDPAYTMQIGANPHMDTTRLRFVYSSLTTPTTTYEQDIQSDERVLLRREPVLGDFDPQHYCSELLWAPARDGERIPISVVYRRDTALQGAAPLYQYGYGAYGHSIDPTFSAARLSLLDRGFVYAIAHVRGGQERGRRWYDTGRLQHKWNTFHDFIDVTDFLVQQGYAAPKRVFAAGGSAGGLLIGVIVNVAPEKYAGLVAHVPFVDIVTTMLDESIPLTTLEYEEWGDPHDAQCYAYLLSYSPYDNVREQAYPPMLITTGLWDSQVQYFEPAKWAARLRDHTTSEQPILLHVDLEAGHGGKSGRFDRLREVAREYAFLIGHARGNFVGASPDAAGS